MQSFRNDLIVPSYTVSQKQMPGSVFFMFLLWPSQSVETGNPKGRGDRSGALLFIETKASGMTGITNSANRAAYLFCMCIKKLLSLQTVSFRKAELD